MENVTLERRLDARSGDGASTPAAVTNRITGSRRWWALGAVMVSMFFSSLDQTIVSAAMPVIIGELHGSACTPGSSLPT